MPEKLFYLETLTRSVTPAVYIVRQESSNVNEIHHIMSRDEIVLIIDKSGSMEYIKEDAIGGFNSFLAEQKRIDREANVTLVLFDDRYQLVHDGVDIREVKKLTDATYLPSGTTALLDAVGSTVDRVGERLDATPEPEKPENVIVFILTDGKENASADYSRDKVKSMIEHQESKYGWEFIYGGANQDAFAEAGSLGIKAENAFDFDATGKGTREAYVQSSDMVASFRMRSTPEEPEGK